MSNPNAALRVVALHVFCYSLHPAPSTGSSSRIATCLTSLLAEAAEAEGTLVDNRCRGLGKISSDCQLR